MSNESNNRISDIIGETVSEIWKIEGRPDLEADCCDYVFERFDEDTIKNLVIEFLSLHCQQALSNKDLKFIAKEKAKEIT